MCPQDEKMENIKQQLDKVSSFRHINLGHVLSMIVPALLLAAAWGQLNGKVAEQDRRIGNLEVGYTSNRDRIAIGDDRILEKLGNLQVEIAAIRSTLEWMKPKIKTSIEGRQNNFTSLKVENAKEIP